MLRGTNACSLWILLLCVEHSNKFKAISGNRRISGQRIHAKIRFAMQGVVYCNGLTQGKSQIYTELKVERLPYPQRHGGLLVYGLGLLCPSALTKFIRFVTSATTAKLVTVNHRQEL